MAKVQKSLNEMFIDYLEEIYKPVRLIRRCPVCGGSHIEESSFPAWPVGRLYTVECRDCFVSVEDYNSEEVARMMWNENFNRLVRRKNKNG